MIAEHRNLIVPIIKAYQKEHQDMYISYKDNMIEVRVGADSGYKKEVLRVKVIKEIGFDKRKIFYDFKIVYFNNRITVTDAYWAISVLTDILLDFTVKLNGHYKEVLDESL